MNLLTFSLIVLVVLWAIPRLFSFLTSKAVVDETPKKPDSLPANFYGGPANGYSTPVQTDPFQDYVVVPYMPKEVESIMGEPNLAYYTASAPLDEADGEMPFIYVRDITARELAELQQYGKTPNIKVEE